MEKQNVSVNGNQKFPTTIETEKDSQNLIKNIDQDKDVETQTKILENITLSEKNKNGDKKSKAKLILSDEFSRTYENSSISNYIRKTKNKTLKNLIKEITVLVESNCINELIPKLTYLDFFWKNKYISNSENEILIILFDNFIKKNVNNFYRLNPVFKILVKLLNKKTKFNFDWKVYYEIYLISYTKGSFEFFFRGFFLNKDKSFVNKFYSKLHKYIKLNDVDLTFLKREIKNLFLSGNDEKYNVALGIIKSFLKKNEKFYDQEIQNLLFEFLKNSDLELNNFSYEIFEFLQKKNNFLLNKEEFINIIFEKLHQIVMKKVTGEVHTIESLRAGNDGKKNDKRIDNLHRILFSIVSHFLIENNSLPIQDLTLINLENPLNNILNDKFNILINMINFNLKENTSNSEIKYYLKLVKNFLFSLKEKTFKKIKVNSNNNEDDLDILDDNEEEDDEENKEANKEYQIIPELKCKLETILITYIEPVIIKSFFYQSNSSNELLHEIAGISESLSNCFLSEKIYETFMLILEDNSNNSIASGNSNWVLMKINCYLKNFFLRMKIDKSLSVKFNNLITESIKNISSANIENSSRIIKFLGRVYNIVRNDYVNISAYNKNLIKILDESIEIIYKKIIDLMDMISNRKFKSSIVSFFHCSSAYINNITEKSENLKYVQIVEKLIFDHIAENLVENDILDCLNLIIQILNNPQRGIMQKLFDWVYENLVLDKNDKKKNKNEDVKENQELFYNSDLIPDIRIRKNIQLDQLNEKNLKYLNLILNSIDIRYIQFNEKNKEKFYNMIGLLIKNKEKHYLKILKSLVTLILSVVNSYELYHNENSEKFDNNKFTKLILPNPEKLHFINNFLKIIFNPLVDILHNKNLEYAEKLEKKYQETENDITKKWKNISNKKLKKKIKREVVENILSEKSYMEQIQLKLLMNFTISLNSAKNVFLLIPHNKNDKFYINLLDEFKNQNNNLNTIELYEEFNKIKHEINKKIMENKNYFSIYKTINKKEILKYYLSFDSYYFTTKKIETRKFLKDQMNILKQFKKKEKDIFQTSTRCIYILNHLDLLRIVSKPDNPKIKNKLTTILFKKIIHTTEKKFKTLFYNHMNFIFTRLNDAKSTQINLHEIYSAIKIYYNKIIDKINPDEPISISLKTKLSNLVFAYSGFISYILESFNVDCSQNSNDENCLNINYIFNDFMNIKSKLCKQNIKELPFIVSNLNMIMNNFFKFFPCSDYIINKKLLSKPDYLNIIEFKNLNESKVENFNLLENEKFLKYFKKKTILEKLTEKIKISNLKNEDNKILYKNTLLEYFENFLNDLKNNRNQFTNNLYFNYISKFEAVYFMYYSMDLENEKYYLLFTEFQEYLFNEFIKDCGYLEKKFCFYLIGFISKLKYKIIIQYKTEKFDDLVKNLAKENPINLEEKIRELKLNYFKNNKQAVDPECPSELDYLLYKNIDYKNIKYSESDLRIKQFLNDSEKMKKFISSFLLIKDIQNDHILNAQLNQTNTIKLSNNKDLNNYIERGLNPLFYPKNSNIFDIMSFIQKNSLFDTLESNMLFYSFIVYDFNNFEMLEKIFNELDFKISNKINEEKLDYVNMSIYLTFLSGYLRKMITMRKLNEIKDHFYIPLELFGNISNEKINQEIIMFYYFLIFNCNIEDLNFLLYNINTQKNIENLIFFNKYSNNTNLIIRFLSIFVPENRATRYVFDNSFKEKLENYLLNLAGNSKEVSRNSQTYTANIRTFIDISNFTKMNYHKFQIEYPQPEELRCFLMKIYDKNILNESKTIKVILNNVLVDYRNYFLKYPDLFITYLNQIINVDSFDTDDYGIIVTNLKEIMINKFTDIDIFKIFELLEENLKENINSSANFLNLPKKLIILDIYSNFIRYYLLNFPHEMKLKIFKSLLEIMNNSQYEIRDYIANNLITNIILTMNCKEKNDILNGLIEKLTDNKPNLYSLNANVGKEDSNYTNKISENLTVVFALGSYLKFFDMSSNHLKEIEKIILVYKFFNSKILKNKGSESKLIKNNMTDFYNRYKHSFEFIRLSLSQDAIEAITDLSKTQSYFM